jgi:hypothetical protein
MKKAAFILGLLLIQGFGGTGGDFSNIKAVPDREWREELRPGSPLQILGNDNMNHCSIRGVHGDSDGPLCNNRVQ